MGTGIHVVLYGLVAATSPLALGATLVVLRSGHGRLNGLMFAIGVLVGQSLVCVLLLALGSAWTPGGGDENDRLRGILDLGFGIALLLAAWHVQRTALPRRTGTTPRGRRSQSWHDRLEGLGPVTAVGTGALLGFGGPKRLGITFLAATSVAAADLSTTASVVLLAVYVLLATVLVWAPVLAYLVFTDRATDWLEARQQWIRDHERSVVVYPSLVLGVVLLISGIVQLGRAG